MIDKKNVDIIRDDNGHARKISAYKINASMFIIFLLYSFFLHVSIIFAGAAYFMNNSTLRPAALDQKVKIPYAQFVSLTGRKGNTYDRSKLNIKADIDKIKSFFSKNSGKIKKYYDFEKKILSSNTSFRHAFLEKNDKNSEIQNVRVALSEKMNFAAISIMEIFKKINKRDSKDKKKDNVIKKENIIKNNTSSKNKLLAGAPVIKQAKKKVNKAAMRKKIVNKKSGGMNIKSYEGGSYSSDFFPDKTFNEPAGKSEVTAAYNENSVLVFGNMSGTQNTGDKLAGAPNGEMDASIEASEIDIFKSIVRKKISSKIEYPQKFRRLEIEGTVRIDFEIMPDGAIGRIEITESSGNSEVDFEALRALKSAQPFVPFPRKVNQNIAFSIPLSYKLRR